MAGGATDYVADDESGVGRTKDIVGALLPLIREAVGAAGVDGKLECVAGVQGLAGGLNVNDRCRESGKANETQE